MSYRLLLWKNLEMRIKRKRIILHCLIFLVLIFSVCISLHWITIGSTANEDRVGLLAEVVDVEKIYKLPKKEGSLVEAKRYYDRKTKISDIDIRDARDESYDDTSMHDRRLKNDLFKRFQDKLVRNAHARDMLNKSIATVPSYGVVYEYKHSQNILLSPHHPHGMPSTHQSHFDVDSVKSSIRADSRGTERQLSENVLTSQRKSKHRQITAEPQHTTKVTEGLVAIETRSKKFIGIVRPESLEASLEDDVDDTSNVKRIKVKQDGSNEIGVDNYEKSQQQNLLLPAKQHNIENILNISNRPVSFESNVHRDPFSLNDNINNFYDTSSQIDSKRLMKSELSKDDMNNFNNFEIASADFAADANAIDFVPLPTRKPLHEETKTLLSRDKNAIPLRSSKSPVDPDDLFAPINVPNVTGINIVAMTLYGSQARYTHGVIKNAQLIKRTFPGWTLRVYMESAALSPRFGLVPNAVIEKLRQLDVEIHYVEPAQDFIPPMMWRFLVADDPSVDRFIVRDTDSRLTERDAAAVAAWIRSGAPFHAIRDHPSHAAYAISGGLWGGRRAALRDVLRQSWVEVMSGLSGEYLRDMSFLNSVIWPRVQHVAYCSDSVSCDHWMNSHPFPVTRHGFEHVGQVYNEQDLGRPGDMKILRDAGENPKCLP